MEPELKVMLVAGWELDVRNPEGHFEPDMFYILVQGGEEEWISEPFVSDEVARSTWIQWQKQFLGH